MFEVQKFIFISMNVLKILVRVWRVGDPSQNLLNIIFCSSDLFLQKHFTQ